MAPVATRIVQIVGGSPDKPVHHVTLDGLSFIGSDFVPDAGKSVPPHGLIYMENANNITVKNCRILNAGISGVHMQHHAQSNTVYGCWIERAGFAGVYMSGYGVGGGPFKNEEESYVNRGHLISNNFIHDCGLFLGHGCGIQFEQSGHNEISHNLISRTPRYGISYKGMRMNALPSMIRGKPRNLETYFAAVHTRNITIRYNDIGNVCRDSHDFGAIECWGAGRDCVWEYNAIHDVDSAVSWNGYANMLYADDGSHYHTMRGNIVHHCHGGGYFGLSIIKGISNVLENNIVADCSMGRPVTVFPQYEPGHSIVIRRNIFVVNPGRHIYTLGRRRHQVIKELDYNLVWPANRYFGRYQRDNFEKHGLQADPQFDRKRPAWDSTHTDYKLKRGSPAFKLGFKQVPVEKIGLKPDFKFDRSRLFRKRATDKIQAEDYDRMHALRTIGATCIYHTGKGSWARYRNVDFGDGKLKRFRAMMSSGGTTISLRLDSPDGREIGKLETGPTNGNRLVSARIKPVKGAHMLYLVFGGGCNVDWFRFE